MEAASENGRRRGRPRVWEPETMDMLRNVNPDLSDRQRQNQLCMVKAIGLLKDYQEHGVLDVSPLLDDETSSVSVLAELGRMDNPRTFVEAVNWWLEERPKVKEAVREMRRMRTGKSTPGSARGLHAELVAQLNDYLSRHPDTTTEQIENALELTLQAAREMD